MGINDEITKLIDQRLDMRLAALTLRLDRGAFRGSSQVEAEVDPDDDDGGGGVVRRRRKKKKARRSKKATASISAARGKKRRKKKRRGTAASIATGRETVLALLKQKGAMRVAQLVDITGVAQSTINKRLNELKDQRLVVRLKEGAHIVYKAARDGRIGRKTAPKPPNVQNGARKSEPPAPLKEIAA